MWHLGVLVKITIVPIIRGAASDCVIVGWQCQGVSHLTMHTLQPDLVLYACTTCLVGQVRPGTPRHHPDVTPLHCGSRPGWHCAAVSCTHMFHCVRPKALHNYREREREITCKQHTKQPAEAPCMYVHTLCRATATPRHAS